MEIHVDHTSFLTVYSECVCVCGVMCVCVYMMCVCVVCVCHVVCMCVVCACGYLSHNKLCIMHTTQARICDISIVRFSLDQADMCKRDSGQVVNK